MTRTGCAGARCHGTRTRSPTGWSGWGWGSRKARHPRRTRRDMEAGRDRGPAPRRRTTGMTPGDEMTASPTPPGSLEQLADMYTRSLTTGAHGLADWAAARLDAADTADRHRRADPGTLARAAAWYASLG